MRYVIFALALSCAQAQAGEWFKTIELSAGLGTEYYKCEWGDCGGYDIGDGVIGKFSVSQSIYSHGRYSVSIEWDHYSDIETNTYETPIDFLGFVIRSEFDWY